VHELIGDVNLSILFVVSILFIIILGFLVKSFLENKISWKIAISFSIVNFSILVHIILDIYGHLNGFESFVGVLTNIIITASIFPISFVFLFHMARKLNSIILYSFYFSLSVCLIADLLLNFYHSIILEATHAISMMGLALGFYFLIMKFIIDNSGRKK
jgi:hypothetical protein